MIWTNKNKTKIIPPSTNTLTNPVLPYEHIEELLPKKSARKRDP